MCHEPRNVTNIGLFGSEFIEILKILRLKFRRRHQLHRVARERAVVDDPAVRVGHQGLVQVFQRMRGRKATSSHGVRR